MTTCISCMGGRRRGCIVRRIALRIYCAMGKYVSKILGNDEVRILMLGLDTSGKTCILENACTHTVICKESSP